MIVSPGLQQRGVDGVVGRRAAQRLDVDIKMIGADAIGGKQLGGPAARQCLQDIGILDPFVIARIAEAAIERPLPIRCPGSPPGSGGGSPRVDTLRRKRCRKLLVRASLTASQALLSEGMRIIVLFLPRVFALQQFVELRIEVGHAAANDKIIGHVRVSSGLLGRFSGARQIRKTGARKEL